MKFDGQIGTPIIEKFHNHSQPAPRRRHRLFLVALLTKGLPATFDTYNVDDVLLTNLPAFVRVLS